MKLYILDFTPTKYSYYRFHVLLYIWLSYLHLRNILFFCITIEVKELIIFVEFFINIFILNLYIRLSVFARNTSTWSSYFFKYNHSENLELMLYLNLICLFQYKLVYYELFYIILFKSNCSIMKWVLFWKVRLNVYIFFI